jgi:hypothetical protein
VIFAARDDSPRPLPPIRNLPSILAAGSPRLVPQNFTMSIRKRAAVGELDICDLCDSSPHVVGCPRHPDYDDERISYVNAEDPEEVAAACHFVEDVYAAAGRDAGLKMDAALREGIAKFRAALERGEIRSVRWRVGRFWTRPTVFRRRH